MQHHSFEPRMVVDVTSAWPKKIAALACYRSQLHTAAAADRTEPMTKVASPEFVSSVIGRAQHFGQMIGAAYGEPFWSPTPLAVGDPLQLLPTGLP
jgi:LmbE family N-acetylglucosaminyl deacetylase